MQRKRNIKTKRKRTIMELGELALEIGLVFISLIMICKIGKYAIELIQHKIFSKQLQESVVFTPDEDFYASVDGQEKIRQEGEDKNEKNIDIPSTIDFESLQKISSNVVAWIYEPSGIINQVIAQAEDNEYYLYRHLDGTDNENGTIFMDYRNHSDFSDWNTLIYGHNMKSGDMFASLLDYRNPRYYEEHPVMYLYTPSKRYKLELLLGYTTTMTDNIYQLPSSNEERQALLDKAYRLSSFESNIKLESEDRLITLSTCSYVYDDARYVVIGRLIEY